MPGIIRIPKLTGVEWLLLLLPMFRFVKIQIVGEVFASEFLLIMLIPLILVSGRAVRLPRSGAVVLMMALCWLAAQIATDLYVDTVVKDFVRGWANISFFILGTIALLLLPVENDRKIWLYLTGWALGGILQVIVAPTVFQQFQPMKWGIGPSLFGLGLVFLSVYQHRSRRLVVGGLIFLTVFSLAFAFRSTALGCMGTLAIYLLSGHFQNWYRMPFVTKAFIAVPVLAGTLVTGLLLFQVYDTATKSGILGAKAQYKHEMQTGSEVGFLLSARGEILVSGLAVLESPIIGHGSWAKDPHFASLYVKLRKGLGQVAEEKELGRIPSHSHLMGAWVEAGIVGAIFWFFILVVCARVLFVEITSPGKADILAVNIILGIMWGTMFSPFNGQARYFLEFGLMLLILKMPGLRREYRLTGRRVESIY